MFRQIDKDYTCSECGEECRHDYYDDFGVMCHIDCATEEIKKQLQYHYYNDMDMGKE